MFPEQHPDARLARFQILRLQSERLADGLVGLAIEVRVGRFARAPRERSRERCVPAGALRFRFDDSLRLGDAALGRRAAIFDLRPCRRAEQQREYEQGQSHHVRDLHVER